MRRDTSRTEPTRSAGASAAREPAVRTAEASFDALFADLTHVVLAVSGGPDSTALMHLAVGWRDQRIASGCEAPLLSVVTVDHGLREGSAEEATWVYQQAAALGLSHTTLRWEGKKPATGIQASARAHRYDLIAKHLVAHGLPAVATAHTADDQAETLLMRLARGSGIDGLAAMRARSGFSDGRTLLRPLLDMHKSDLIAYLQALEVGWLLDPSNAHTDFERVRLRNALSAATNAGYPLGSDALVRTARRSRRAADALATLTRQTWVRAGSHARFDPLGFASLDWHWLQSHPEEIRIRLLAALVDRIGGQQEEAVSLGQLEAVTAGTGWALPAGLTLHGTEWASDDQGRLQIWREPGRLPDQLGPIELPGGAHLTWDRRFELSSASAAPTATVLPLTPGGLSEIEAAGFQRPRVKARVLWTLPAMRGDGRIVSVPGLGFALPGYEGWYHADPLVPHFGAISVSG